MSDYKKPVVWRWEDENENRAGNRPTAGSRFEQILPKGEKPLQVYSLGTPNGIKVTIMLEELKAAGLNLDYDLFNINIGQGDQFGSDFVALNPNSKIPAMLDQETGIPVFESANILLYLAEKYGKLLPKDIKQKTEVLNWLFWQTGAAPFVGGGFGHFFHYAPTEQEYPINRYTMETKRQLDLLNQLLAERPYVAGQDYSIADISIWSWYGRLVKDEVYPGAAAFLDAFAYPHLLTWAEKIAKRPAVQRGLAADYQFI
ncbi:glutathione-dependent disulfide-bond oxidoreductase [Streptococcus sp. X16XC17]|uniref:glutathione-dependent disulfide-bond oxidoreductase n=1 Tax=unclassified Streptococcus TaxID=2608887 RepID=UPI00066FDAE6|nr:MULTISPECIES: glutathione-dependent disulfide-bond oxidoreductase [unclassified Streptococcus]TCD46134.1 glutathione-dependent disulfide-bond oxidoreductase [Streptococcus sp. X16XC17]